MESTKTLAEVLCSNPNPQYLGKGAVRMVWALDETRVLKVDHSAKAAATYGGCNSEAEAYRNASEPLKSFLAPVLDSGDGWLIMARATQTLDGARNADYATVTSSLRAATRGSINDLHGGNIGYFESEDKWLLIDYAFTNDVYKNAWDMSLPSVSTPTTFADSTSIPLACDCSECRAAAEIDAGIDGSDTRIARMNAMFI